MDLSAGQATWTPIRIGRDQAATVDWCYTKGITFDDPFFAQTVERCLREPFRLLFRRHTPWQDLAQTVPRRSPTGLIFHLSRSGSTLVSRMLATAAESRVLSEPGPLEDVLTMQGTLDQRAEALRTIVSALGPDLDGGGPYILKLDAWAVLDFDAFRLAFPGVPWLFCYRDPADVLASQSLQRGYHMVPGVLPSERLGIPTSLLASLTLDEYGAAVLGRLLECAGDATETEPVGLLVHHAELPGAVDRIIDHVGIDRSLLDADALRRTAEQDAKNPALAYPGTPRGRRADAEPALVAAADRFAADAYVRLEQLRRRAADGGA